MVITAYSKIVFLKTMKKKILITGASGFVGSHLVDEAIKRDYEVYAGVRSTSSRKYLQHPGIQFFEVDFSKPDNLESDLQAFAKISGGFDYVIHNAGVTRPKKISDFDQNATYSKMLAEQSLSTQPELKKFLFMSSIAAIGPNRKQSDPPITEQKSYDPLTPYGESKMKAEQGLMSIDDLPYIIVRPTGVYGPRDKNFGKIFGAMQKGIDMRIANDSQRLSFIYVRDLVRACIDLLECEANRTTFNMTDGAYYSPSDFSELVKSQVGVKAFKLRIPRPLLFGISYLLWGLASIQRKSFHLSPYKMRELTAPSWYCDISALNSAINFEAEYDLKRGIEEYYPWYTANT